MPDAELKFLRWYYANADFGPADDDVRQYLKECYVEQTGDPLPPGYEIEAEDA